MSSYSDMRGWTAEEEVVMRRVRAIDITIPKDVQNAADEARRVHENPCIVIANWMREEAAKAAETYPKIAAVIRKIGTR